MRIHLPRLVFFCFFLASTAGFCADSPGGLLEEYLREQTRTLPGKTSFSIHLPDLSRQPACSSYQAYTPAGARMTGKTSIGLRCLAPNAWSVLVPVHISVVSSYLVTARPLLAGQPITAEDLATMSGDISNLPASILTQPEAAVGKILRNSIAAGLPLRSEQLQAPLVVRQGQNVRVVSRGDGFSVASEGRAVTNASAGQVVQIRMNSGQTVSGVAQNDGSVEIAF